MEHREILERLSKRLLGDEGIANQLPKEVLESGWLGYPGCTSDQISAAEERLNVTFPPSLRQFYMITNGWRDINSFVYGIFPIEKIDYLPNVDPALTSVVEQTAEIPGDPDYTDEQLTRVVRSLVLSTEGDATTTLIDPESDLGNGEWNVGAWASWHPAMEWSGQDWWSYLDSQGVA